MAKKRRDKERDSSSIGKVAKVGTAALSVGVGAASFSKLGYTKKFTSEIAPALINTTRSIRKDITKAKASRSGLNKSIKMQDIYDTYHNHLKGNKTFKNELEKSKIAAQRKIKLKSDEKISSFSGQIKDFYQTQYNDLDTKLKQALRSRKELDIYFNEIAEKYKDKDLDKVRQLSKEAFASIEEHSVANKYGEISYSKFLDGRFKDAGFNEKEKKEFLDII